MFPKPAAAVSGLTLAALLAQPSSSIACSRESRPLSCAKAALQSASFELSTRGVALAASAPHEPFWEEWKIDGPGRPLTTADEAVAFAAQRAIELDSANAIAHSVLARELLILGQAAVAEGVWRHVFEGGGSVSWPVRVANLGNREGIVAFSPVGLRLYPAAARKDRVPAVGDPFWLASGGCVEGIVNATTAISWDLVREIRSDRGSLSFQLREPVSLLSVKGKPERKDRLVFRLQSWSKNAAQLDLDAVRHLLVSLVDPERRISSTH